jgi:hypothetical protein
MAVSVVVPFSPSDEWREKAWDYVSQWWLTHFPDWEVIRCAPGKKVWSKGAALHNGVAAAAGDTLILADADSFIADPGELQTLVDKVDSGSVPWLMPHRYVHRVSQIATEAIYAGAHVDIADVQYPVYGGCMGGGMTVLTRDAWNTVKGVDPRFTGWGGEDRCFGWALAALCPPITRGDARLVHLWHPTQGPRRALSPETVALVARYQRVRHTPAQMRALIAARKS